MTRRIFLGILGAVSACLGLPAAARARHTSTSNIKLLMANRFMVEYARHSALGIYTASYHDDPIKRRLTINTYMPIVDGRDLVGDWIVQHTEHGEGRCTCMATPTTIPGSEHNETITIKHLDDSGRPLAAVRYSGLTLDGITCQGKYTDNSLLICTITLDYVGRDQIGQGIVYAPYVPLNQEN